MSTTCSSSLAHHKMEISGLSERFVAGMWRQFLLVELCWHIVIVSAGFQTHLRVGELPPASNNQPIYGSRCQSVSRMLFDEVDPDDCNPDNWDLLTDTVFPYGLLQYWVLRQQDRIRLRHARREVNALAVILIHTFNDTNCELCIEGIYLKPSVV